MDKYFKDFDNWNRRKKKINEAMPIVYFYEREIWWISMGTNVGVEIDGKNSFFERPVLIIKKINKDLAWILPITSSGKENPYMYYLQVMDSFISISQFKCISTKRLLRKEGIISINEFAQIIIRILFLLTTHNETTTQ